MKKLNALLFFILISTSAIYGQGVSILNASGTSFQSQIIDGVGGETLFRVHIFENFSSTNTFSGGNIELSHTGNLGAADYALDEIHIVVGNCNPYDLGSSCPISSPFDPEDDPFASGGPLDIANTYISAATYLNWTNTSGNFLTNQIFSAPDVPSGEMLFIVEEFSVVDCPVSANTFNLELLTSFISSSQLMCNNAFVGGTSTCGPISHDGNIEISPSAPAIFTMTYGPGNQTLNELAEPVNGNCEMNCVQREIRFTLANRALMDPQFRIRLNAINAFNYQLFEAETNNFEIDLHLDTDGIGGVDTDIIGINFDDLDNDVSPNSTVNNVVLSHWSGAVVNTAANNTTTPATIPSTFLYPNHPNWPIANTHTKAANFVLTKESLDGGAPVFAGCDLNLSQLYVETANGDILNSLDDFINNNNFLTIYPGSWISLRYTGCFVDEADITPANLALVENEIPQLSQELFSFTGLDACDVVLTSLAGQTWQTLPNVNAGRTISAPEFPISDETGLFFTFGTNDGMAMGGASTWDGDLLELEIGMPDARPLNGTWVVQDNDPLRIQLNDSEIEFEIDLGRGLSIPCPDIAATTINGLANSAAPTTICATQNFGASSAGGTYTYGPTGACPNLEVGDVFWIELANGDRIVPEEMTIEPVNSTNCNLGQRWRVRLPMYLFLNQNNGWLLSGARMRLNVQAYCPADEPKVEVDVRAYVIPLERNTSIPLQLINSPQYIEDIGAPPVFHNQPTVNANNCPENRFLVGKTELEGFVNCPGCVTPGVAVVPSDPVRHHDFIGWDDHNDDGRGSTLGSTGTPSKADTAIIDRGMVRHGDVMSRRVATYLYDPSLALVLNDDSQQDNQDTLCLSSPLDEFSSSHLANNGVVLDQWVYEMDFVPDMATNVQGMFYPLIKDATDHQGNATRIFQADDDMNFAEYDLLASQYPSFVEVILNGVPTNYELSENELVWIGTTLRISLDIADLYSEMNAQNPGAFPSSNVPDSFAGNGWELNYNLNFITNVTHNPWTGTGFFAEAAVPNEPNSDAVPVQLLDFSYITDEPSSDLLDQSDPSILPNHPDEWEEAIGVDLSVTPNHPCGTNVTKIGPATWWCEKGGGLFKVAPYYQSRTMLNQDRTSTPEIGIMNLIPEDAAISKCTKPGPMLTLASGDRAFSSTNHFPFEIRPGDLPDSIIFHVPEPFIPEAILVRNSAGMMTVGNRYQTAPVSHETRYFIPLQGINAPIVTPATGGTTVYANGIKVESGILMEDEFYPHYPVGAIANNLPGGSSTIGSGTPLPMLNIPPDNAIGNGPEKVRHYRISIPLEYFHEHSTIDVTSGTNPHISGASLDVINIYDGNYSTGATKLPMIVGDEQQGVLAYIFYSMPTCQDTNSTFIADDEPFVEDACWRRENNSFFYYTGNNEQLRAYPYGISNNANPVGIAIVDQPTPAALVPSLFSNPISLYPSENLKMILPSMITVAPMEFGSSTSLETISPENNHRLNGDQVNLVGTSLASKYRGIVPPYSARTGNPNSSNQRFFFFDQRSAFKFDPNHPNISEVNGDPNDRTFNISFKISGELIEELSPLVAPCDLNAAAVDQIINTMIGASGNIPYYNTWFTRFGQHRSVLDGMYFYLRPSAIGSQISPSNLFEHVELLDVQADLQHASNSANGYSSSEDYTNGGANVKSPLMAENGNPRLFELPFIPVETFINNGIDREHEVEVTLTCRFNCEDVGILNSILSNGTDYEFPFEVGVNYNCTRGEELWNRQNSNDWYDSQLEEYSSSNDPSINELNWNDARSMRCSNDRLLDSLEIVAPTVDYEVSINSVGCGLYQITIDNNSNGGITVQSVEFELTTGNGTSTISVNLGSPVDIAGGGDWTSLIQDLSTYSVGTLIATASAGAYCASCDPSASSSYCIDVESDPYIHSGIGTNPGVLSGNQTICEGSTTTITTDGDSGGLWSVATGGSSIISVDPNTGVVTGLSPGNAQVQYTVNAVPPCTGSVSSTISVTVVGLPNAGTTTDFSICAGSTLTIADLDASLTGADAGGTWSPTPNGAGTYTYTVPATSPCTTDATVSVTVTEQAQPNAGTATGFAICAGSTLTIADLDASLTGADAGGTWSPTPSGAGMYTYTVQATSPCTADAMVSVTVTEQAQPNAGTATGFAICTGSTLTIADLDASLTGADAGGTWSPTPNGAGTYTYTVPATSPCTTDATVSVTVTEQAQPNAGTSTGFAICAGSTLTIADLDASLTGADAGGIWSPTPNGAGTYTYTVQATSPCNTDAMVSVTVTEQAQPNAGTSTGFAICAGSTLTIADLDASLTGADAGGIWSPTPNGAGTYTYTVQATSPCNTDAMVSVTVTEQAQPNAGTATGFAICTGSTLTIADLDASLAGADAGGTWSPTPNGAGTYTYTVPATSPCTTDATVSVMVTEQAQPNAGTSTGFAICAGSTLTIADLDASLTGADAGGIWSPTPNGAGTYTYTVPATSPCNTDAMVSVTVTEQAQPNAGTSTGFAICAGSTLTIADLDASLTGADAGGTWTPTPNGAGMYTYTVQATSPCNTDAMVSVAVTEQAQPNAGTTTDFAICAGSTLTIADLNASLTGADAGGTWSPTPSGAGMYTYTVQATSPCTADAMVSVTVTEQAQPNAGTATGFAICAGSTLTIADLDASLAGADAGGTWSPTPNGAGTYTYTVQATFPCTTPATVSVMVTTQVQPNAGAITVTPQTICVGSTSQATSTGDPGGVWSLSPSGTNVASIDPVTGLITGQNPGAATVIYTVNAISPCTGSASTSVDFSVVGPPNSGILSSTQNPICEGGNAVISTNGDPGGTWSVSSISQGASATIDQNGNLTAVSSGTVEVSYTVSNPQGPCPSSVSTITITIDPLVTPTFDQHPNICFGDTPNLPTTSTNIDPISGMWTIYSGNTSSLTYAFVPDPGQCAEIVFMTIGMDPLPPIGYQVVKPSCACDGQIFSTLPFPYQMSVAALTGGQGGAVNYQPLPNGNNLCSGNYQLTFTNVLTGCSSTTTVNLTNAGNAQAPQYLSTLAPGVSYTPQSGQPLWVTGSLNVPAGTQLLLTAEEVIIDHNAIVNVEGTLIIRGTIMEFHNEQHEMNIAVGGNVIVEPFGNTSSRLTTGRCGHTWAGVRNSGTFSIDRSILEHARIGVQSLGAGPSITALDATFRNNYVGINVADDPVMNLNVQGNTFTVGNNGLRPYPWSANAVPFQFKASQHILLDNDQLNGGVCTISNNNLFRRAEHGVEVRNSSENFSIGISNRFRQNDIGVLVDLNCDRITINENDFRTNAADEIGVLVQNGSKSTVVGNNFDSQNSGLVSNYIGVQTTTGASTRVLDNDFESFIGKGDVAIVGEGTSTSVIGNDNQIDEFDLGILGNSDAFVNLSRNTISNSLTGIELNQARLANSLINENLIINGSVANWPISNTLGIRVIGNSSSGAASLSENTIWGTFLSIQAFNGASVEVSDNSIQRTDRGIHFRNTGKSFVLNNSVDLVIRDGIFIQNVTQNNAPYVNNNTIVNSFDNGIRFSNSWYTTISNNNVNAATTLSNNGRGISLVNSNHLTSVSPLGYSLEGNTVNDFRIGIYAKQSEFGRMDQNTIENSRIGIRLEQDVYNTINSLVENTMKSCRTGLSCKRLPVVPGTSIELRLQCNVFEECTNRAKHFVSGLWELSDLIGAPIIHSVFIQGNTSGSGFRRVVLANGSSVQYQWPIPISFPQIGQPFYHPSVTVNGPLSPGRVIPVGVNPPAFNPCSFSAKSISEDTSYDQIFDVSIHPNPSSGYFTVVPKGGTVNGIVIFNSLGEKVYEQSNMDSLKVDISHEANGIYMMHVQSEDGEVKVKRIVLSNNVE